MSFRELYDRLNAGDAVLTASAIATDLALTVRGREYLFGVIVNECEAIERERVRLVEAQSLRPLRNGKPATGAADRARLLAETFSIGNGKRVLWGEATADDHRARVAMLQRMSDGITATVARHLAAIAEIEAAGAQCLNDLQAGAA